MSITSELRDFVDELACHKVTRDMLREIADRIDEKHEDELTMERGRAITELGSDIALNYIQLPKDADGVPIRVGDTVVDWETPRPVAAVSKDSICLSGYEYDSYYRMGIAKNYRHHHEPTVEDVLEELLREYDRDDSELTNGEIIERFAAKLRLAGDE